MEEKKQKLGEKFDNPITIDDDHNDDDDENDDNMNTVSSSANVALKTEPHSISDGD